jgi:hypothetical protein
MIYLVDGINAKVGARQSDRLMPRALTDFSLQMGAVN